MKHAITRRQILLGAGAIAAAAAPAQPPSWTQWGGPTRDFRVADSLKLRDTWPSSGPKIVWKRDLGDGYSSVTIDGADLYTLYKRGNDEVTLAADAATGKSRWEQGSSTSFRSAYPDPGHGPYATPLVLADRVITAGVTGRIECRARKDGSLLWAQELWKDHKGTRLDYGYSSSPLSYRDTVIVPCGGRGKSMLALHARDGSIAWSRLDHPNVYSSPMLIDVGGLEQLVQLMDGHVIGLNPINGDLQWSVPFKAQYSIAVAAPVWTGQYLFVSAEYEAGAKAIRLERNGNGVKASEAWTSNRLRLHHGNAIHLDGTLYFSSGGKSSVALLTAIDAATGNIHWQERAVSKATFVWADRKLITLDQSGALMLADPSPKGWKVLAKAEMLAGTAWTPPSLVGTRLYLRNRQSMVAVELG